MARNFFHYTKVSFEGGQNDTDEPDQIDDNQAVLLQDVITNSKGVLSSRKGSAFVGNELETADPVVGLTTYILDNGTARELRMETTSLQYNNSGTWTNIDTGFTTGLDTWFTQANNKVYISNGTDNTHSYDGTTVTDLGTSYPKAKYSAWWKNYLFLCGDGNVGGTGYKSRVWFSNLGDPDTITTGTDYFDVSASDGQEITGIAPLGQFLVIFKRKSIHILTGSNPSEWVLSSSVNNMVTIANGIGCVSAKSIVQVGNDLWFASDDGFRSIMRNEEGSVPLIGIVSGNINTTFDSINKSAYSKICGAYYDNKVYFAIPTGTSTTNNKVVVANTRIRLDNQLNPHPWFTYQGWAPYVFNVHLSGNEAQLHWGDSAKTNVLHGETTNADADSTISVDVRGKMLDFGAPEMKKTFRFMKAGFRGSGNYNLDIYYSKNGSTYTLIDTINLAQGSLWGTAVWGTDTWSVVGEKKKKVSFKIGSPQLQIRFASEGNDQPIDIYPYTLAVKQRKIK